MDDYFISTQTLDEKSITILKITMYIIFAISSVLIYFLNKGKNFARVIIILIVSIHSFWNNDINSIDDDYLTNLSSYFFIIGTILLLFPSVHKFFLEQKKESLKDESIAYPFTRVVAYNIDIFILSLMFHIASHYYYETFLENSLILNRTIGFIVTLFYFTFFEYFLQTTPGKKLLFLKIGDNQLKRVSFHKIFLKSFIFFIGLFYFQTFSNPLLATFFASYLFSTIVLTGYFVLVSPSNQTHYDMLTNSYVYYETTSKDIQTEKLWSISYKFALFLVAIIVYISYHINHDSDSVKIKVKQDILALNKVSKVSLRQGSALVKRDGTKAPYMEVTIIYKGDFKKGKYESETLLINIAKAVINYYKNPGEYIVIIINYGYDFGVYNFFFHEIESRSTQQWKDELYFLNKLK
jgi:hypothetical protein